MLGGDSAEAGHELLSGEQRELERVMLGMRTRAGLAVATLDQDALDSLCEDGLVEIAGTQAVATLRGRMLGDTITRRLTAGAWGAPASLADQSAKAV